MGCSFIAGIQEALPSWTDIRDTAESALVLVGNYVVPGSSILTKNIASKGSQDQLNSELGQLAQIGTSLYGMSSPLSMGEKLGQASGGLIGSAPAAAQTGMSAMPGSTPVMAESAGAGASNITNPLGQAQAATNVAAPQATGELAGRVAEKAGEGVWGTISSKLGTAGAWIEAHPTATMMGLNMVTSGLSGIETAKQKEAQAAEEKRRYDIGVANANAPFNLNVRLNRKKPGLIEGARTARTV